MPGLVSLPSFKPVWQAALVVVVLVNAGTVPKSLLYTRSSSFTAKPVPPSLIVISTAGLISTSSITFCMNIAFICWVSTIGDTISSPNPKLALILNESVWSSSTIPVPVLLSGDEIASSDNLSLKIVLLTSKSLYDVEAADAPVTSSVIILSKYWYVGWVTVLESFTSRALTLNAL